MYVHSRTNHHPILAGIHGWSSMRCNSVNSRKGLEFHHVEEFDEFQRIQEISTNYSTFQELLECP
jgi:hypothetical protein